MRLLDRLTAPGPKRILSLDGGGLRGIMSLGLLRRMERVLRERHRRQDLVLADYFDLIGGTSTGAVIAAGLALGWDVARIFDLYQQLGRTVLSRRRWWIERARFEAAPLESALRGALGDHTLGDESVLTGLCIVTKRADTGSTWPLLNHPHSNFYDVNRSILLRDAVRASTAAPTFFEPEKLSVRPGEYGAFVDGGVSMASNPALQLFLVATLSGFHFNWPIGEHQLLLVSVGTGVWRRDDDVHRVASQRLLNWAQDVPLMLMEDANWQNQLLLQFLSRSQTPWPIDSEVGDLSADLLTPGASVDLSTIRRVARSNWTRGARAARTCRDASALSRLRRHWQYRGPGAHRRARRGADQARALPRAVRSSATKVGRLTNKERAGSTNMLRGMARCRGTVATPRSSDRGRRSRRRGAATTQGQGPTWPRSRPSNRPPACAGHRV